MNLHEYRCFRKDDGTYAIYGITFEALSKKTIMKKIRKLYPVEISKYEYEEMKKGNFSILPEHEYNEREEKGKTPKKEKIAAEIDQKTEHVQEVQEVQDIEKKQKKVLSAPSAVAKQPTITSNEDNESKQIKPVEKEKKKDSFCDVSKIETESNETTAYIGLTQEKKPVLLDFKKAIHCLVAGSTGSGKSVMLHSIIASLMKSNTPETARFLLIDPKRVEFFDYSSSAMLYGGKVYENVQEAINALESVSYEMNDRYIQLKYAHARSIDDLPPSSKMYRVFVVIDELSFLMLEDKKKMEDLISKIGMLGRAAGMHLILATQHPDRKTLTGTIQANIPTVIGLATRKAVDSRMIVGSNACTRLKGRGDAILIDGLDEIHFQGTYVSSEDIQKIVNSQQAQTAAYVPPRILEKMKNLQQFRS